MEANDATMDDLVVDMVLEVDSRGIDVEGLSRLICLPGTRILQTSAHGTIWLTALIRADGHAAAIRQMHDEVWSQLPEPTRGTVTAALSCVSLGDLYARLGSHLADDDLAEIDVRDLVARTLWDCPPAADLRFDEPTSRAPVVHGGMSGALASA